eukprot:scaffold103417_cov76-Phaeocystis_antarctica.AAC.2
MPVVSSGHRVPRMRGCPPCPRTPNRVYRRYSVPHIRTHDDEHSNTLTPTRDRVAYTLIRLQGGCVTSPACSFGGRFCQLPSNTVRAASFGTDGWLRPQCEAKPLDGVRAARQVPAARALLDLDCGTAQP